MPPPRPARKRRRRRGEGGLRRPLRAAPPARRRRGRSHARRRTRAVPRRPRLGPDGIGRSLRFRGCPVPRAARRRARSEPASKPARARAHPTPPPGPSRNQCFKGVGDAHPFLVAERGVDRREWETEWEGLEPLVIDSPAEALPEVDRLIERMLIARGYPTTEEGASRFRRPQAIVAEFLRRAESRI